MNDGVPFPPSLRNIFTEINADTGAPIPASGTLDRWAEQGVLLLNAVLTVRAHEAASHAGKGWEQFTDAVVKAISERAMVDPTRNLVLKCPHPSPFSANNGFFGCRHFSKANEYLAGHGKEPVRW